MNSITKFSLSIAAVVLTSAAAIAGEQVQSGPYGQSGAVSYYKRAPRQNTTVAVYRDGSGVGQAPAPDQTQWNFHSRTFGSYGNGAPVSYYSQSR
jgi:hypothetical protein